LDPITHVLYGATLGRAGLNRVTPLATATVALAAEAPDIDVFVRLFADSVTSFDQHRGITHSLAGAPLVAALVVAVIYGLQRLLDWACRGHPQGGPVWLRWARARGAPRWGLLYLCACLGALSHILLDYTNGYGVRPLLPFVDRWWSGDIVFILEPVMTGLLFAGLALPALFSLVQEEIGARKRGPRGHAGAIVALLLVAALWGVRHHYHGRAVALLWEQSDYQGQGALRVGAYPYPMNPFLWHGIVETATFYQTQNVDLRRRLVNPDGRSRMFFKPQPSEVVEAARASRLAGVYLNWAAFPVLEIQPVGREQRGWEVRFVDLRFLYPTREGVPLGARLLLSRDLEVLGEVWGPPAREPAYLRALEELQRPVPATD
jgi:inner membrane protein